MRENWLEEGLREKFDGFDSELNLEEAWVALDQERSVPNKRRPSWLWVIAGSLLFISTATALYQWPDEQTSDIAYKDIVVEKIHNRADAAKVEAGNETSMVEVKTLAKELLAQTTDEEDIAQVEEALDITTQPQLLDAQSTIETTKVNESSIAQYSFPATNRENVLTVSTVKAPIENRQIDSQIKGLDGIPSYIDRDFKQFLNFNLDDLASSDRKRKSKSIPQYVGVGFGFSPLTSGTVLDNEEALDAASAQVFYKKYLSNRFYIKSGLGLDRFTTRQEGSTALTTTSMEPDQIIARIIYDNGSIDNVLGEGEVTTTETTEYQLYNRYQFVSIPVIAGFRVVDRKLTSLEIEGGMATTISSQYDVKSFNPGNGGRVEQLEDLNLRTTSIFNGVFSAQWNYHPQRIKRLELYVRAGTRFQLNDISTEAQFNIDKFRAYQLGLGIQYRM